MPQLLDVAVPALVAVENLPLLAAVDIEAVFDVLLIVFVAAEDRASDVGILVAAAAGVVVAPAVVVVVVVVADEVVVADKVVVAAEVVVAADRVVATAPTPLMTCL